MMVALPGLTATCLTKEWTKTLVSVNSLVLRNSLISSAKAVIVSTLPRVIRRFDRMALAPPGASSPSQWGIERFYSLSAHVTIGPTFEGT